MTRQIKAVLIALDASPRSLTALETAAKVAAAMNAEIRGVYVEDIDLLRTAEFPFASVVSSSGQVSALTPDTLSLQLRRHANLARTAVETIGLRSSVASSFSLVRGSIFKEITKAAATAEFVAVGRSGWSEFGGKLGSVTRSLIEGGTTSLLIVAEAGIREPIVVLYDGSPSSDRALTLLQAVAGRRSHSVTVFVTEESQAIRARLNQRLKDLNDLLDLDVRHGHPTALLKIFKSGTILIPATVLATLESPDILEQQNSSVFLIR
jgi:nucleotide-binding universal stress UspA family protein